jgi:hypothetical protein
MQLLPFFRVFVNLVFCTFTCLEQAMDRPERFPHTLLDICEEDDVDILVRVMTNHRAHASVDALCWQLGSSVRKLGPMRTIFQPIGNRKSPQMTEMNMFREQLKFT